MGVDVELEEEGMAFWSRADYAREGVRRVTRDLSPSASHITYLILRLTISKIPSLAAALLQPSSPSGCASVAIAAGHIINGALLSKPRILRFIFTSDTFLRILGRSMTLRMSSRFFVHVTKSVAAEE